MSSTNPVGSEVIYQMPAVGVTKTTTTQSLVSGNAAGNPAFQMPALASIWAPDRMAGKGLWFLAGGTYDATAVTNAMVLSYDPTQGTIGTTIAATGACTVVSSTTASWSMNVLLTCTQAGNNTSNWMSSGAIEYGPS